MNPPFVSRKFFLTLSALLVFAFSSTMAKELKILALGDSLTEGYGVEKDEAYPFLLELALRKMGYRSVKVINAGISGSTSASAKSRLKWYLRAKPAILILALGGNDGLRGLSVENMKKQLGETIELAQSNNIRVLMAGMQMPLNYGPAYTNSFRNAFYELSNIYRIPLIPFLLKNVGGVPEHNLEDGIHPNPEGHRIVMKNVLEHLVPMFKK